MSDETRVSDEDRERMAARLREAAGEGRLGFDELEDRLAAAWAAKTRGELEWLGADLPATRARPRPARRPKSFAPRGDLQPYVATMVLLVAIWALTGAGYFWPIWPMLGWGIAFLPLGHGCGHRRHRRLPG